MLFCTCLTSTMYWLQSIYMVWCKQNTSRIWSYVCTSWDPPNLRTYSTASYSSSYVWPWTLIHHLKFLQDLYCISQLVFTTPLMPRFLKFVICSLYHGCHPAIWSGISILKLHASQFMSYEYQRNSKPINKYHKQSV